MSGDFQGSGYLMPGLGTVGLATVWAAVFADVGVALLAVLNAVRLQKIKF